MKWFRIGRAFGPALVAAASISAAAGQDTPAGAAQVRAWMQEGAAAMRAGKPAEAVAPLSRAAAAQPSDPSVELGLGMAQLGAGQLAGARASLQHALELDPSMEGAHLFLGIAEYQTGEAKEALANIGSELKLKPDNVEALTWTGIISLNGNDPETAASTLDHAARLAPGNAQILYYQGRAHSEMATAAYQALYKLDPDSVLVHRALGESLSASGQPAKAIAEFEAALRKQPGNADLLEELGDEDQKVSRFDDATLTYEQELKINPHSAIALYNLGKIDVERGKPADGIKLLQQAATLGSSPAPTQFYLGYGFAQLNQDQQAATALEASLAANPSPFISQSTWYQLGRVYTRLGRKSDAQHAFAELAREKAAVSPASSP